MKRERERERERDKEERTRRRRRYRGALKWMEKGKEQHGIKLEPVTCVCGDESGKLEPAAAWGRSSTRRGGKAVARLS